MAVARVLLASVVSSISGEQVARVIFDRPSTSRIRAGGSAVGRRQAGQEKRVGGKKSKPGRKKAAAEIHQAEPFAAREGFGSGAWTAGLLVVAILIAGGMQIRLYDGVLQDDAYISFVYARNLAEGHGLVYNRGEPPVEGYTNFLWTVVSGVGISLGLDPAHVTQILSMLAVAAAVILVWRLAVAMGTPPTLAALAGLLLATKMPIALEAMGGLETVMFMFLILSALVLRLPERPTLSREIAGSFVLAAAALTRPEGVLFFGLFELFELVRWLIAGKGRGFAEYSRRTALRALPFVLIVSAHVSWRYVTYGDIVPNTFHAKVSGRPGLYRQGISYVWSGIRDFVPLLYFIPFLGLFWRRTERAWLLSMYLSIAFCLYQISVGGDYKNTMRFLIPILPMWCALAVDGARFVSEQVKIPSRMVRQVAAALLILTLGGWSAQRHAERDKSRFGRWRRIAQLKAIGRHLDVTLPKDAWIAVTNAGIIPYYSRRRTIDMLGLNDAHIARQPAKLGQRMMIGHEKGDGDYVLGRSPDAILFFRLEATGGSAFQRGAWLPVAQRMAIGASEKEIAAHPAFPRNYQPRSTRMPDGTFLNYFIRKAR
jgi:hypothetical protein